MGGLMFKGIGDKLSCLVRQTPQSGSNYPPIVLTYCIHKVISLNYNYRLFTDPVCLLWPPCCLFYQNQIIVN